jgi:hypothetical protein
MREDVRRTMHRPESGAAADLVLALSHMDTLRCEAVAVDFLTSSYVGWL